MSQILVLGFVFNGVAGYEDGIFNRKSCPYEVEDQTADAWVPTILEADVESTCPFWSKGDQNLEVCQDCAALHAPCNDTYAACGGCQCTQWHESMDFEVPTSLTCEQIQGYFKTRNTKNVTCRNHSMDLPDPNNTGKLNFSTHNTSENAPTLLTGYVKSECETPVRCLQCEKIPFKSRFECDTCGSKGVPLLLKKCCDVCKAWVDGLQNDSSVPDHIKMYGWCSGCHVESVPSLLVPGMDIPWRDDQGNLYRDLYSNYTEDKADAGMEEHVREHICEKLSPTCDASTSTPEPSTTERPTMLLSTPASTTTDPFAEVRSSRYSCMHQTGSCNGGRRLSPKERFLTAMQSGFAAARTPVPSTSCSAFNSTYMKPMNTMSASTTFMRTLTGTPESVLALNKTPIGTEVENALTPIDGCYGFCAHAAFIVLVCQLLSQFS